MKYNSLIIIPTYNEAENIEAVIKKVIDLEDENDVLVVDDNSPDGTSKIVENQKNIHNNRVFLLKREKKSGLGSAYKAGFKWALENNYSYIFEMDADMSHDPNEIKNLKIQLSQNKYDVVVGSRYIKGVSVVNWPLSRIFLSYSANLYVRIITGMPIKDATSGFVGYTKNALNSIVECPTRLITFSDDMDGLRKIPDNVPNTDILKKNLGKPLTDIPDPFKKFKSFGEHNNEKLKEFLKEFKFDFVFKSATENYKKGIFNDPLIRVLEKYEDIMNIILPTLREERRKTYCPFLPICPKKGTVLEIPMISMDKKTGKIIFDNSGEKIETGDKTIPFKAGGTVTYNQKVAYKPSLETAELTLTGKVYKGVIGGKEKTKEAIPSTKLADATIITPLLVRKDYKVIGDNKFEFQRIKEYSISAMINFDKAQSKVKASELKGDDISALKEFMTTSVNNPKIKIKSIGINGYASPEGETKRNDSLFC